MDDRRVETNRLVLAVQRQGLLRHMRAPKTPAASQLEHLALVTTGTRFTNGQAVKKSSCPRAGLVNVGRLSAPLSAAFAGVMAAAPLGLACFLFVGHAQLPSSTSYIQGANPLAVELKIATSRRRAGALWVTAREMRMPSSAHHPGAAREINSFPFPSAAAAVRANIIALPRRIPPSPDAKGAQSTCRERDPADALHGLQRRAGARQETEESSALPGHARDMVQQIMRRLVAASRRCPPSSKRVASLSLEQLEAHLRVSSSPFT